MTHIVIKLDHEPFEVTRGVFDDTGRFAYQRCVVRQTPTAPRDWHCRGAGVDQMGRFGDYLICSRGKIEVWSPEDVERYIKNPYEECARVAEEAELTVNLAVGQADGASMAAKQISQAIRQLEQKDAPKTNQEVQQVNERDAIVAWARSGVSVHAGFFKRLWWACNVVFNPVEFFSAVARRMANQVERGEHLKDQPDG